MKLSEHFSLNEFLISQRATRLGIDNAPTEEHLANLRKVAAAGEIIRAHFGPVHISSGYRSKALNAATPGSSKTSAHCFGLAMDFHIDGVKNIDICRWIVANLDDYDQVIYEYGPAPVGWVHLGLRNGIPRKQQITCKTGADGKPDYLPGILDLWK